MRKHVALRRCTWDAVEKMPGITLICSSGLPHLYIMLMCGVDPARRWNRHKAVAKVYEFVDQVPV